MKKLLISIIILFLMGCQTKITLHSNTDFYILDDKKMYQFEYKDTVNLLESKQYTSQSLYMEPSRIETTNLYFTTYRASKQSNQVIFNKTNFSTKISEKLGYADPIAIGNDKVFYVTNALSHFIIQRANMDNVIEKEVSLDIKSASNGIVYDNGKIYLLLRDVIENSKGDYDAYIAEIIVMNEELEVIERRQIETSEVGYIDLIKIKDTFYLSGFYKASAYEYIPANIVMAYNWETEEKSYIELQTEWPEYFIYDDVKNVLLVMHNPDYELGNKVTQIDLNTLQQSTIIFDETYTRWAGSNFFVKIHHNKYYVLLPTKLCIYDTATKQVEMIDLTQYGISEANTLVFP